MEILELLLVMEPLLGALCPQLARPRALYLDDLLGGRVLGKILCEFKSKGVFLLPLIKWMIVCEEFRIYV